MSKGKEYTGIDIDGLLHPKHERIMIATYNGPMLGLFDHANPQVEVRNDINKEQGNGEEDSLTGRRSVELGWFRPATMLYIDPMSGRGGQEVVGWSNYDLTDWLRHFGFNEIDPITIDGLLDGLSEKDTYTMLFVKAVLTFRTICVGYSVKGCQWEGCKEFPVVMVGDKKKKIGQVRIKECTINLDCFTSYETFVAVMSSEQYPGIKCRNGDTDCSYTKISLPKCDIQFVSSDIICIDKQVPTPRQWWKGLVGLAAKLGAIDDLVAAFRITRGLAAWAVGLRKLGLEEYNMTLGITGTRGCRSVLRDSVLTKVDEVIEPSNLPCSLGELICDWAAGQEMINVLFHMSDEFGLANRVINRNVTGLSNCSVGDSLLREANFYDMGCKNRFYLEVCKRICSEVSFLGNEDLKKLMQMMTDKMISATDQDMREDREELRSIKNLAFTNYFGPMWTQNATVASHLEGKINSDTWGAISRSKKEDFFLRMWLDINGLSDKVMLYGGYNVLQRVGLEEINQTSMAKFEGAHGTYNEVYREMNWRDTCETRVGNETIEKDMLNFVKTYLGMEDDNTKTVEVIGVMGKCTLGQTMHQDFRGTLEGMEPVGHEDDTVREKDPTTEGGAEDVTRRSNNRTWMQSVHLSEPGKRTRSTFGTTRIGLEKGK